MKSTPKVGSIVTLNGIRGQVRLVYNDAPMVAVITFPQDVAHCEGRHYEDWPIKQVKKYNQKIQPTEKSG